MSVQLAHQLFSLIVSNSHLSLGRTNVTSNYAETAECRNIFHRWFSIMNLKSPSKGFLSLKDKFGYLSHNFKYNVYVCT